MHLDDLWEIPLPSDVERCPCCWLSADVWFKDDTEKGYLLRAIDSSTLKGIAHMQFKLSLKPSIASFLP
jgi:hypothetical protein